MNLLPLNGNYIFSKTPWLNWSQLNVGLKKGFINEQGISDYICNGLTKTSPPEAYEIATLNATEHQLLRELLQTLINKDSHQVESEEEAIKPWIYLTLSYLYENKDLSKDPFESIEELYADLDYPEEIAPIVRYMPLPEGVVGSEEQLYENWKTILSNYEDYFQNRLKQH
ncbi:DUF2247 family protein [Pseudomonas koreensis]